MLARDLNFGESGKKTLRSSHFRFFFLLEDFFFFFTQLCPSASAQPWRPQREGAACARYVMLDCCVQQEKEREDEQLSN